MVIMWTRFGASYIIRVWLFHCPNKIFLDGAISHVTTSTFTSKKYLLTVSEYKVLTFVGSVGSAKN